jgi:hypothetical protein
MPKPEIYGETLYVRVPKGTQDRIKGVMKPGEKAADAIRRLLLEKLEREERRHPRT